MGFIRLRPGLDLEPRNDYTKQIERGNTIYTGLTTHPAIFVVPYAGLPAFQDKLQKLDQAQKKVTTGTKGLAAVRNVCARELLTELEGARYYVQQLCDANPEQAVVFIEAAGMVVIGPGAYNKPILAATQLEASTTVHLVANAGLLTKDIKGKVYFNWQYTTNNGQTWINARPTPHAVTDIVGLAPMQTYGFRVCVGHATGDGAWTAMVTLLVT